MLRNYDVIFIGGAVMAASTAYSLLTDQPNTKVLIIEKDPTYERASSPLALGGFRQQFSTRVNIRLARQSIMVYENFEETMESSLGKPQIDLQHVGYFFIVTKEKWPTALEIAKIQREEGVEIELLEPKDISEAIPSLKMDKVAGGTICHREGILDPQQVMYGYINKARDLGAHFIYDEVVGVERNSGKAVGVLLKSGEKYYGGSIVNSAGPWAGQVGEMAGVNVPVKPLPHDIYVTETLPAVNVGNAYTTLPSNAWWYRESLGAKVMLTGKTRLDLGYEFNYVPDRNYFIDKVWPELVERMDSLDRLKLIGAWRGCYEYNIHDFNAIIGEHHELENFFLINGFSGHGLMQAPAAGKALAELIIYGKYKTLDLFELRPSRFAEGELVEEKAII